jgi:hypothetical protein
MSEPNHDYIDWFGVVVSFEKKNLNAQTRTGRFRVGEAGSCNDVCI